MAEQAVLEVAEMAAAIIRHTPLVAEEADILAVGADPHFPVAVLEVLVQDL
tara:strand:+ start:389 stop:541 length:153 start_codon:yes stop_codon:yes gene_type:complete